MPTNDEVQSHSAEASPESADDVGQRTLAALLAVVRKYLEAHTRALVIEVHPNTNSMAPTLSAKLLRFVTLSPLIVWMKGVYFLLLAVQTILAPPRLALPAARTALMNGWRVCFALYRSVLP